MFQRQSFKWLSTLVLLIGLVVSAGALRAFDFVHASIANAQSTVPSPTLPRTITVVGEGKVKL